MTEMEEALMQPRYANQEQQMRSYLARVHSLGLVTEDASLPLFCVGVQVWDLRHPDAKSLQETWWDHIMQCGLEDQVSFFIVQQLFPHGTVRQLPGKVTWSPMKVPFSNFDAFANILLH